MFNHETEIRFHRLLLALAKFERNIELMRQKLAKEYNFEPFAAFQRIDRDCNGFITKEELIDFLK